MIQKTRSRIDQKSIRDRKKVLFERLDANQKI